MSPADARSVTRIARGLLVGGVLLYALGPGVAEAQAPPYPASAGFVATDSPDRWNAIGGGNAVAIALGGTVTFDVATIGGGNAVVITLGGTVTFDVATGEPHDASFEPSSGAACSVAGGQFTTRIPPAPAAAWSGTCTFSQPGYHAFVCTVHRGMTGEVAVAGADGRLPPRAGETPPPAAPTPPPADPTTSGPPTPPACARSSRSTAGSAAPSCAVRSPTPAPRRRRRSTSARAVATSAPPAAPPPAASDCFA